MLKKPIYLILLVCSAAVTANAQEVECNLPSQWKCGARMAPTFNGFSHGSIDWIDCCHDSVQSNACNTNGEDSLCGGDESISGPN